MGGEIPMAEATPMGGEIPGGAAGGEPREAHVFPPLRLGNRRVP
jgi:hypothetical protein